MPLRAQTREHIREQTCSGFSRRSPSAWESSSSPLAAPATTTSTAAAQRSTQRLAPHRRVFTEEIRKRGWKPAASRLTMGADPIVTAVSVVSGELNGF